MVLDLTLVADRHDPTSRTYLTYLADGGVRLREVAVVDFLYGTGPKRRFGSGISSFLLQRHSAPAVDPGPRFFELCDRIQDQVERPIAYSEPFRFEDHAERISTFVADDYDDPAFQRFLLNREVTTFLYTNGGRVPAELLDRPEVRILHIHPGVVPHVRGSDGLLWSLLVRGTPGASCFYMDPGLDTGAVIHTREFARPDFSALASEIREDPDLVYRVLLHAYDPHLRAITFSEALQKGSDPAALPSQTQDLAEGRQYFAMHRRIRDHVFQEISGG